LVLLDLFLWSEDHNQYILKPLPRAHAQAVGHI